MNIHSVCVWWLEGVRERMEITFPNNAGDIVVTRDNLAEYVRERHPTWTEYFAYDANGEVITYVIAEV